SPHPTAAGMGAHLEDGPGGSRTPSTEPNVTFPPTPTAGMGAHPGRAPDWQSGGQGFDPPRLHKKRPTLKVGLFLVGRGRSRPPLRGFAARWLGTIPLGPAVPRRGGVHSVSTSLDVRRALGVDVTRRGVCTRPTASSRRGGRTRRTGSHAV